MVFFIFFTYCGFSNANIIQHDTIKEIKFQNKNNHGKIITIQKQDKIKLYLKNQQVVKGKLNSINEEYIKVADTKANFDQIETIVLFDNKILKTRLIASAISTGVTILSVTGLLVSWGQAWGGGSAFWDILFSVFMLIFIFALPVTILLLLLTLVSIFFRKKIDLKNWKIIL